MKTPYECNDLPFIKISLMDHDEIVYEIESNNLIDYYESFSTDERRIELYFKSFNPEDYAVLTSKVYNKYLIESNNFWFNTETKEEEQIQHPTKVFDHFLIEQDLHSNKVSTAWHLSFWEEH